MSSQNNSEIYYASEYTGFAAALTGLGAMTVLYDPLGEYGYSANCWYKNRTSRSEKSIRDYDVCTVNEDTYIQRIAVDAGILKPEFICLLDTPNAEMLGDHVDAVALKLQHITGIPCYGISMTGREDYDYGEELAYGLIYKLFIKECKPKSHTVNLLGLTELDAQSHAEREMLKYFIMDCGYEVNCHIGGGSPTSAVARAGSAEANIVLSMSALPLAEQMKLELGIPYTFGSIRDVSDKVKLAEFLKVDTYAPEEVCTNEERVLVVGEQAAANAKREYLKDILGYVNVDVACLFGFKRVFADALDVKLTNADDITRLLDEGKYDIVYCDPAFREFCRDVQFHSFPHRAISREQIYIYELSGQQ